MNIAQAIAAAVILSFAAIGALWVDGRLDRCAERDGYLEVLVHEP
jgi:hypothetical protein